MSNNINDLWADLVDQLVKMLVEQGYDRYDIYISLLEGERPDPELAQLFHDLYDELID